MGSAADTRALFADTKRRLIERLHGNINNWGSLVRQIVRGSKTSEQLTQCSKAFVNCEHAMDNTQSHIDKLVNINNSMIQPVEVRSFD